MIHVFQLLVNNYKSARKELKSDYFGLHFALKGYKGRIIADAHFFVHAQSPCLKHVFNSGSNALTAIIC